MQPPIHFSTLAGCLLWIAATFPAPSAFSAESFLALGKVGANGAIASSASRSGAAVVSSRVGVGSYNVSIVHSGAFQNANPDHYVIEAGIASSSSSDIGITASVLSLGNDALVIRFRTADLETSGSPDDPVAVDQAFYFIIRDSPDSGTTPGDSRHLLATGLYKEIFFTLPQLCVGGGRLFALRNSAGDVELSLENPGGFVKDKPDDYLIFATSTKSGVEDEILRAEVKSTLLNSSVTFTIRNDDVQAGSPGNAGTPVDGEFSFAIYRIDRARTTGVPPSKLIALRASVDGSDGSKKNGSGSLPGSSVISSRSSEGIYLVKLVKPGAFQTGDDQYAAMVAVRGDLLDRVGSARAHAINENTLQIIVWIKDVQSSGQAEGVLVDNDFDLVVYDFKSAYGVDMAVGTRPSAGSMRTFGSRANQFVTLKLRGTRWGSFFIGYENTGRTVDVLRVFPGYIGGIYERYFHLGPTRRNISANVRRSEIALTDQRPGQRTYIKGEIRYRSMKKRIRFSKSMRGQSALAPRDLIDYFSVRVRRR